MPPRRAIAALTLSLLCLFVTAAEAKKKPVKKPPHAKKAAARPAPAPPAATKPEAEEIEEIEAVEPEPPDDESPSNDGKGATEQGNKPHSLVEWLSRMHAAMVHMPIAWTMLLCLFDIATFIFGRRELKKAGLYLAILALCSCLPAAITGLLRLDHLPQEPTVVAPALVHRNIMYVSSGILALIVILRAWRRNDLDGLWRTYYVALVAMVTVLVAVGAHLGGALVYGDDFLPFF